jgi:hypothetical protein
MKFLKITLGLDGTSLVYPDRYQEEIGNFSVDHLYAGNDLVLVIPEDKFVSTMVREGVAEITEEEAKAISEANETRTEVIVNDATLRRLEIKSRIGTALTAAEKKMIDPAVDGGAIETTKILSDRIDALKK